LAKHTGSVLTPQFSDYLRERRSEIEQALATVLPTPPQCPPVIATAMHYSLSAGGKRLRPVLCLAAADAVGPHRALAMPAACALELIHTYSLIHDDLPAMDNDSLRRGRPTLHVVAGDGMAILAGDGLLTEAFALLARVPGNAAHDTQARQLRVIGVIAEAAGPMGMVGGQAIDLSCSNADPSGQRAGPLDAEGLRTMHARKTGALIRASAVAGAIMGGGADPTIARIDAAAADFGLAFQIVDDILDVEGGSAELGKTPGKDAASGKPTYPALYGLAKAREMAIACLERAEDELRSAGLADSWLMEIGRWIVHRSS
jgi:geranylgeranyl diphosphate synthase type II